MEAGTIPWRGPGPGRPELPLPPGPMPLRRDGQTRKRWRYIGVYTEQLMLCAARAQVGPLSQSFWVLWDRERGEQLAHTAMRPGSREVRMDGPSLEIEARGLRASLTLGAENSPIETICPSSGGSGWGWTQKRAGVPIAGTVEIPGQRWQLEGLGVDDQSAGYHQRRTSWHWSAGVGTAADGRALAWNLVEGINDPPRSSERAIWVDGVPSEPGPSRFDGLEAIECDGARLEFSAEAERSREESRLGVSYSYRQPFGTFSGSLPGGLELAEGLGVVEHHHANW